MQVGLVLVQQVPLLVECQVEVFLLVRRQVVDDRLDELALARPLLGALQPLPAAARRRRRICDVTDIPLANITQLFCDNVC